MNNMKKVPVGNDLSPDHPDVSLHSVEDHDDLGHVHIHNNVIATIARLAAMKAPGVVEMSGGMVDSLAGMIGKKAADRGIRVEASDQGLTLHLHVVLDYGIRIPVVCGQIQEDVRKAVEQMTGKAVRAVEVIVEGIRIGGEKKAHPGEGDAT
jgi:uncharacterized alkaline shock family protein YloU